MLLEIYPARELPMDGVTSALIYDQLTSGEKHLISKEQLLETIKGKNDIEVLVTIGAGDIDKYVEPIKQILEN
jgi:UDP-N-acetylmuramate--alanine ligase